MRLYRKFVRIFRSAVKQNRAVDKIRSAHIGRVRDARPKQPESHLLLVLDHDDHVGPVVRGHLHDDAVRAVPAREEPRGVALRNDQSVTGDAARKVRRVREEPLARVPLLRAPCLLRPRQRAASESETERSLAHTDFHFRLQLEQQFHTALAL